MLSTEKNFPSGALKNWFKKEKRSLPWRDNASSYAVMVSEVMLQQTQAVTVVPYFLKWMREFPDVMTLASADELVVLKAWEGLGYYSRARNLQKAAKLICEKWNQEVPSDEVSLKELPGIGDYTAAAIMSFGFKKRAIPIDGNVLRVATRYFGIASPINQPKTKGIVKTLLEGVFESEEPWIVAEALIELGATLCSKKAQCEKCPLKLSCVANANNLQGVLPKKEVKVKTLYLERDIFVAICGSKILLKNPEKKGLMQGLYEFPYREKGSDEKFLEGVFIEELPLIKQTFTRYRLSLFPSIWGFMEEQMLEGTFWIEITLAKVLPFSSAHRKIFRLLEKG